MDPATSIHIEAEDILLFFADDFVQTMTEAALKLCEHRGSHVLDVRDLELPLEKEYNISIPGFGAQDYFPAIPSNTEAHEQRLGQVRKTRSQTRKRTRSTKA